MLSARPSIWFALMLRDMRARRGRTAESFLLTLIEPMGQLLIVYFVFLSLQRQPDFGDSLLLFLLTGIMPYFLFTHIVGRIMTSIRVATPMLPLGAVSVIDVAIAQLILESLVVLIFGTVLMGGLWLSGQDAALPRDGIALTLSLGFTALAAFGVGIFNAAIVTFFSAYRLLWLLFSRSLLFFSSVFFVIDQLAPDLRDLLWWNPLLHGVIWFRTAMFADYPSTTLSVGYLIGFSLVAILLGLSLETLVRRRT